MNRGFVLTALTFLPLFGAMAVLLIPAEPPNAPRTVHGGNAGSEARSVWRVAFVMSLFPLALSAFLLWKFSPIDRGYQLIEQHEWIPQFGISYHVGVDGISLFLILLTTLLISISLL